MALASRALFLSRALQAGAASRNVPTLLRPLPAAASLLSTAAAAAAASPGAGVRCFATQPATSSLRDSSQNWSRRPPKEQVPPGCDFEHWLVFMEPPPGVASNPDITRDVIIDIYIKTLAQVVGSDEEARQKIYSVSTRDYFAFGALVSQEFYWKLKELPMVRYVVPDFYLDVENKDYGGEPFINGEAVPYDPKYHEEWLRHSLNTRPDHGMDTEKVETKCMDTEKIETKCMDTEKIDTKCMDIEKMKKTAKEVESMWYLKTTYSKSSHRDGAIYRNWIVKKEWPEVDITNRNETLLEPMMFSEPTENCFYYLEECKLHYPTDMLQVMSLTLVHAPVSNCPMQLYGYVAVRDERDWMLNYVFNHSRDDPIVVQQGSSIEMTGPKRGIEMYPPILIEYDLRIKNGGLEEDDMDLIDGAMACFLRTPSKPVKHRIDGNCGTVDISLAFVEDAVEATVEVIISDAQRGLSLSLGSLVNIALAYEEIQHFQGTIDQLSLRRFVVAVPMNTEMLLKLKVDNNRAEHYISFKAKNHGCDRQSMKLELCHIAVKVTWSAICVGSPDFL